MALPAQSVRKEQNKKRLLEMFERMTEEQQLIYLRHLEKLQANWKRSHARRRCQIDVDYDTREGGAAGSKRDRHRVRKPHPSPAGDHHVAHGAARVKGRG